MTEVGTAALLFLSLTAVALLVAIFSNVIDTATDFRRRQAHGHIRRDPWSSALV